MLSREENREPVEAIREEADAARKVGDFNAAELLYQKLIEMGEICEWAWFSLGQIALAQKQSEQAIECFSQAIAHSPEFFWPHYERLTILLKTGASAEKLAAAADVAAGALPPGFALVHCANVETAAVQLWDARLHSQSVRLLEWISASPHLTPLALVRILEKSRDPKRVADSTERLMVRDPASLEGHVLRVLSDHMRELGNRDAELHLLRQYWQSAPNDFAAYLNLGRRLAQDGAEDELTKLRPAGTRFPSRQRSFAEIVFLVETNKSLLAFQRLRRHARLFVEVPMLLAIRTAYALAEIRDEGPLEQVTALLTVWHGEEDDVIVLMINLAIRRQDWAAAWALFDGCFAGRSGGVALNVRLIEIDLLAYTKQLDRALEKLDAERINGFFPPRLVQPAVRLLGEAGRWDAVVDVGLAALPGTVSYEHVLAPVVRAARKVGRLTDLHAALSGMPHPLASAHQTALEAVIEDMVLHEDGDLNALSGEHQLSRRRLERVALLAPVKPRTEGAQEYKRPWAVLYCVDRGYMTPGFTSLVSGIVSNLTAAVDIDFHLLAEDDIFEEAQDLGQQVAKALGQSVTVTPAAAVVPDPSLLRESYGIFTGGQSLSLAAYYRIFFARYLVANHSYTRLLYLDADTLVRSGLDKLLGGPMEQPLMARHEVSRPEVEYAIRTHGLKSPYFNSGVLMLDATDPELPTLLDRAVAAAIDPEQLLVFQDQCALNIAFDTRHAPLQKRYNAFLTPDLGPEEVEDAVVVHYLDRPKPWDSLYRRNAEEWLNAYALLQALCWPTPVVTPSTVAVRKPAEETSPAEKK